MASVRRSSERPRRASTQEICVAMACALMAACGSVRKNDVDGSTAIDAATDAPSKESGSDGANTGGGPGTTDAATDRPGGAGGGRGGSAVAGAGGGGRSGGAAGGAASPDAGAPTDAATCTPTAEQCNGKDDDCDGIVDDGCPLDDAVIGTSGSPMDGPVFATLTQAQIAKFAAPCPDGQQIIALTGNAGSAIDALGAKCGTLRVHEDRSTTPYAYSVVVEPGDVFAPQGGMGGVAQGIEAALGCRINEVVVGIDAWWPTATGTCAADYCPSGVKTGCTTLGGLRVTCASYAIKGAPGSFTLALGAGRASATAGTGEATGRSTQSLACTAPAAAHRLDGATGPFLSNCASTVVQGLRATCTTPTLPVR